MFVVEFDIIDEITTPGIKLRFCEKHNKNRTPFIQSYNDMTGEWSTMHRFGDMFSEWARWETTLAPIRTN